MASTKLHLEYILEQLAQLDDIAYRAMMGEYILYYRGRIVGGLYDDRLLVKPVAAAKSYLGDMREVSPYPGAKPMLLVEDVDQPGYIARLFQMMYDELPVKKNKNVAA